MDNREQDAKELAAAYQRVDEAAAAFMKSMEVALPLYHSWMEARKIRDAKKAEVSAKYINK